MPVMAGGRRGQSNVLHQVFAIATPTNSPLFGEPAELCDVAGSNIKGWAAFSQPQKLPLFMNQRLGSRTLGR